MLSLLRRLQVAAPPAGCHARRSILRAMRGTMGILALAIGTTAALVAAKLGTADQAPAAPATSATAELLHLLTYDHGGLVLWGHDHFAERLRNAVSWLDKYPGFKIGLDNEAYTYDALAEQNPKLLDELRSCLRRYADQFDILAQLHEYQGRSGETQIASGSGTGRFEAVDLLGRNGRPVTGPLAFKPWQIQTVRIERSR